MPLLKYRPRMPDAIADTIVLPRPPCGLQKMTDDVFLTTWSQCSRVARECVTGSIRRSVRDKLDGRLAERMIEMAKIERVDQNQDMAVSINFLRPPDQFIRNGIGKRSQTNKPNRLPQSEASIKCWSSAHFTSVASCRPAQSVNHFLKKDAELCAQRYSIR